MPKCVSYPYALEIYWILRLLTQCECLINLLSESLDVGFNLPLTAKERHGNYKQRQDFGCNLPLTAKERHGNYKQRQDFGWNS